MTDLHNQLVRSLAATGSHLRVVDTPTLAEVEAELEQVRAEIEPLQRAEAALLKRREELWKQEDSAA